jgi:hypothetical protein
MDVRIKAETKNDVVWVSKMGRKEELPKSYG